MALGLVGPAANMQCGTRAQRDKRQASAQEAKSLRRYGGRSFVEWIGTLDAPARVIRDKVRNRYEYLKRTSTVGTYAEWLAESGITLPPLEPVQRNNSAAPREAGLYINVKAAAKVDEWIPWVLLIAAKRRPLNPAEVER